jgi:hypothetical protein
MPGFRLAFSPAAIVWHHRRRTPSIRAYIRQQMGYGEAEKPAREETPRALQPRRVHTVGRPRVRGPTQGLVGLSTLHLPRRLGAALFQTLYQKEPSSLLEVPTMIQWVPPVGRDPLSCRLYPCGSSPWVSACVGFRLGGPRRRADHELPVRLTRAQGVKKALVIGFLHFIHPSYVGTDDSQPAEAWQAYVVFVATLGLLRPGPRARSRGWRAGRRRPGATGVSARATVSRSCAPSSASSRHDASPRRLDRTGTITICSSTGTTAAEGRLYTAPEHYGQALCFGFKAYIAPAGRLADWLDDLLRHEC